MSLVGKNAPTFKSPAIINGKETSDFNFDDYLGKTEVVLFFYPKDFTFVCPTELFAFQNRLEKFEAKGVKVIAVSTDTAETHWAWLNTPKDQGGIKGVTYPIVADEAKTIAMKYGVLGGEYFYNEKDELDFEGAPIAFRGTFFIDKEGIVRHEYINFFPIGRNVEDTLRIVDAWHHFQEHGEVCPADWKEGEDAMKGSHEGVADYLSKH
ncbi:peroxiredoxin [Candidatus Kapabacteria bacterium]|nr:peroxiredoxin [Candidatus Kapabacteria bacterium]